MKENYLLDTQTLLWFLCADQNLGKLARSIILSYQNTCFLSIASLWEITVKVSSGKLSLQVSLSDITQTLEHNNIQLLPIQVLHLQQLENLSFHDRGPFDRMIIAQAKAGEMTILTRDRHFAAYGVPVVWE